MNFGLALIAAVLAPSLAFAEVVTTTDGREIDLKSDGTFAILESAIKPAVELEEQTPFFEPFAGEYGQNSIRFMPTFLNKSGRTVVGFKFRTRFKSAFGDEIFVFEGESSEKIASGQPSTADAFYYFEDNQFMSNEPYDKLTIFHASGTGTISTTLLAVVFEDGEVVKIEN